MFIKGRIPSKYLDVVLRTFTAAATLTLQIKWKINKHKINEIM